MRPAGHPYSPLSDVEISRIHAGMLRILSEMGMEIGCRSLLERFAEAGYPVDFEANRVRFPVEAVERFITEAGVYDWSTAIPGVTAAAGVYHGRYHDPVTGHLVPWDEGRLGTYFALARHLPDIGGASMLGCRLSVPPALEPLYERTVCWKHGVREAGSIQRTALCPFILELCHIRAGSLGLPVEEVFRGSVYLTGPLRFGRHEAEQTVYFLERGLEVTIGGSMPTMGATAPVTAAGSVTLNLAERIALSITRWVLYGRKELSLGSAIAGMDMRTTIRPYGRPETAVANLMTAQLARFYGASFSGQAGLTDAKLPSTEAGAQKAMTALPTLLCGGSVWIDAGLLSTDEVCSPVQMVLDAELVSALKRFTRELEITAESIGIDTVLAAGPGGQYLDVDHTASRFRDELWEPAIWSRTMLGQWMNSGGLTDVERARETVLRFMESEREERPEPDDAEREWAAVIRRAAADML